MRNQLYPKLFGSIHEILETLPAPDEPRKAILLKIAAWMGTVEGTRNLLFVCTHNSRRSHLAQFWAKAASVFYEVDRVYTFSAGTEVTAMNLNTIDAMIEAGFEISKIDKNGTNPIYEVRLGGTLPVINSFSKTIHDESIPKSDLCAVMVCSEAEEACPFVPGASARIPLSFEDPKLSDNTPQKRAVYRERSQQIAREMLWLMEQVAKK